jgi:hypothetical protein
MQRNPFDNRAARVLAQMIVSPRHVGRCSPECLCWDLRKHPPIAREIAEAKKPKKGR